MLYHATNKSTANSVQQADTKKQMAEIVLNDISVLFLSPSWQYDGYGIANINRSLISNLRAADPEGKGVKIHCAVVEEEGKIPQKDREDSKKHSVSLVGAKTPLFHRKKPELAWLDEYSAKYYRYIAKEIRPDYVIGHVPYLAGGALDIKELCKEKGKSTQVILVVHSPPKTDCGK